MGLEEITNPKTKGATCLRCGNRTVGKILIRAEQRTTDHYKSGAPKYDRLASMAKSLCEEHLVEEWKNLREFFGGGL